MESAVSTLVGWKMWGKCKVMYLGGFSNFASLYE